MATGEAVGEGIARRIGVRIQAAGLKPLQAADRAGIPRETFSRKLNRKPETFTVQDLARLADALEVPFEALAFEQASA